MKKYRNINGISGISAYDFGNDWINITFTDGATYEYKTSKVGQIHINKMKELAEMGDGLNSYIMSNPAVKNGWSCKT